MGMGSLTTHSHLKGSIMIKFFLKIFVIIFVITNKNFGQESERSLSKAPNNNTICEFTGVRSLNRIIINQFQKKLGELHLIESIEVFFHSGNEAKIQFKYNKENKIHSYNNFFKIDGNWTEDSQVEYFYDGNGRISEIMEKFLSGNQWTNGMLFSYYYDLPGNKKAETTKFWEKKAWADFDSISFSYDDSGKLILNEVFRWKENKWENAYKDTLIYHSTTNNIITKIYMKWENQNWQNYIMLDYYYDEKNKNDMNISYLWNGYNWNEYSKAVFNWRDNYQFLAININFFNNNKWQETERLISYYNSAGYLTESMYEYKQNGNWILGDGSIGVENPDGFEIHYFAEGMIIYYGNPPIVSVNEDPLENQHPLKFNLMQNYPNPFNPSTQIVYQIPKDGFVNVSVYNSLGQEVKNLVNQFQTRGKYTVQFNAGDVPSGVYLYRIQSGNFKEIKKMLLAK
jgi:hypothetical protein